MALLASSKALSIVSEALTTGSEALPAHFEALQAGFKALQLALIYSQETREWSSNEALNVTPSNPKGGGRTGTSGCMTEAHLTPRSKSSVFSSASFMAG